MRRRASLMRFALNAPQSPRFDVTRITAARAGPPLAMGAGRRSSGNRSASSGVTRSASTERSASAYGRAATTRSWARLSLLVATSSIVRVIFRVFCTDLIRPRSCRPLPAMLLGPEERLERGDRRVEGRGQLLVEGTPGPDALEHRARSRAEILQEIALPLPDVADVHVVEEAVGDGVDDRHLPLHRQRPDRDRERGGEGKRGEFGGGRSL